MIKPVKTMIKVFIKKVLVSLFALFAMQFPPTLKSLCIMGSNYQFPITGICQHFFTIPLYKKRKK
jgi:hypothetical protein